MSRTGGPRPLLRLAALFVAGCAGEMPIGSFPPTVDAAALDDPNLQDAALDLAAGALGWGQWLRGWWPAADVLEQAPRRVFVSAYAPGGPVTASGIGPDLAGSLLAATDTLAAGGATAEARFGIEVATSTSAFWLEDGSFLEAAPSELGTFGVWIQDESGACYATSTEIADAGIWDEDEEMMRLRGERSLAEVMARHDPRCHDLLAAPRGLRLNVRAWQQGEHGEALPLYRGGAEPPDATRAELLRRAVAAGDYLAAAVDRDGRFAYLYDAGKDQGRDDRYNLVRHAGALYALLQLQERTGWERYGIAVRRGLRWLVSQSVSERLGKRGREVMRFFPEGEPLRVKLGSAAVAATALAEYQRISGDRRHLRALRELGRFLLFQLDPKTAQPRSYYEVPGKYFDPGHDSAYYPGETLLALVNLYRVDRDARWLKGARDLANWLIRGRDASQATEDLGHDHWLLLGLAALHHIDRDGAYAAHALRLARAIEQAHRGAQHPDVLAQPDYLGATQDPPRAAPAAIRLEGLGGAMDLLRDLRNEGGRRRYVELGTDIARQVMRAQVLPPTADRLPDACAAMGGVRAGLLSQKIRVDYVQHAISAWLALERHLPAGDAALRAYSDPDPRNPPVDRAALFAGGTDYTAHHRVTSEIGRAPEPGDGEEGAAAAPPARRSWRCGS